MKIALVNMTLDPGRGSDLVVKTLAEALAENNDVSVFAPLGAKLVPAGCTLHVGSGNIKGPGRWSAALSVIRTLHEHAETFDVINCHHALLSLILPKDRLVTTYHGYRGRLNFMFGRRMAERISKAIRDLVIRRALRLSRAVTLVSQSLVAEAHAAGRSDARVIYNGVERLLDDTAEYPFTSGDYFLYVGRIDPDKSVDRLIDLYCSTAVQIPLLIVGEGADRKHLATNCNDPRIRFLGPRDRRDLPLLFAGARAFVTASTYETFCLPVIEAAQFGRPSLGPASGALTEVIRDGETGFLFDSSNFHSQLGELARMDAVALEEMSKNCKKWSSHFNWPKVAGQYEAVYRGIHAA